MMAQVQFIHDVTGEKSNIAVWPIVHFLNTYSTPVPAT